MTDDDRLPNPATRTEGEGETLDMPEGFQSFTPGQVMEDNPNPNATPTAATAF